MDGNICQAISELEVCFPYVLEDRLIKLSLLCLRFVDMALNSIHEKNGKSYFTLSYGNRRYKCTVSSGVRENDRGRIWKFREP